MSGRLLALAGLCLALLLSHAAAVESGGEEAPLEVRVFSLHYRPVEDAAVLVNHLLGPRGSYRLQPSLGLLTVEDEKASLEKIARVLASFDVAPPSVAFTVHLIRATESGQAPETFQDEIRGITESLQDLTRWTEFRRIGSVSLECLEGDTAEASFPDSAYRMELRVDLVQQQQGRVRLAPFRLLEERPDAAGEPHLARVLGSVLNLRDGQMLTQAAASSERSPEALFVTIQARIQD